MTRRTPALKGIAALALGPLLAGCVAPPITTRGDTSPVGDPATAIADFVELANQARADAGCSGRLVWHEGVAAVAVAHSDDMSRRDYFNHVDPQQRTPMDRVQAAAIPVSAVAENIALGQPSGRAVFESWRDSPGHRRNMLNCGYTHHGVGLVDGYWTHVLVRLAPALR